jgi:hypothetical protein
MVVFLAALVAMIGTFGSWRRGLVSGGRQARALRRPRQSGAAGIGGRGPVLSPWGELARRSL